MLRVGIIGAISLAAVRLAGATTIEECEARGFADVVRPYRHLTPTYDGTRRLDIYLPDRAAPAAIIVAVHGGGWSAGDWRLSCPAVWLVNRVAEGFAVASVEYTLAGPVPPTLGGSADNVVRQVREVKHAIRWLKSQHAALGIDPTRVVLTGGSAGAHLATLAALTDGDPAYEPRDAPPGDARVQLVFAVAGVYDIGVFDDGWGVSIGGVWPGLVPNVFGCWPATIASWRPCGEATVHAASPIRHVDPGDPKVLVLHGAADGVVPARHAARFAAELCRHGRLARHAVLDAAHNLDPLLAENGWLGVFLLVGLDDLYDDPC